MAETDGVPRRLMPTVVTAMALDAGPTPRVRFHALVVRAYREWESGTGGPVWLRCSADGPGVTAGEE
ncbi:hypothetical protein [Actinophytocola sp.]|uniref:hypothetical protein n=1 Tax=Actinophytocola sp. TaxID=1872138 RepID=UPI00389B11FE